tara:strand:- start:2452 stop:2580 length:129 start_codon:yes stop_codon:yes gene_type:complete
MIAEIINLLKYTESSNSYVQIAKGKNKKPESIKEPIHKLKMN